MAWLQEVFWLDEMAGSAMTLSIAEVRRILDDAEIDPKRSLGQNFVVDPPAPTLLTKNPDMGSGRFGSTAGSKP